MFPSNLNLSSKIDTSNKEVMIDLHGRSVEQAEEDVSKSIQLYSQLGFKRILIITGKGNHVNSKGERGTIRKQAKIWFESEELKEYIDSVEPGPGSYSVKLKKDNKFKSYSTMGSMLYGEFGLTLTTEILKQLEQESKSNLSVLGYLGFIYLNKKEEDKSKGLQMLTDAANKGDSFSLMTLAETYATGVPNFLESSLHKTAPLYERVIAQNNEYSIEARFRLGCAYQMGEGVYQNDEKAIENITIAANAGFGLAQLNLGDIHAAGIRQKKKILFKDEVLANKWYERAAKQDYVEAQIKLSSRLQDGIGFPEADSIQAFFWIKRAADLGDVQSKYIVGLCLRDGIGTEVDIEKSIEYFRGAVDGGNNIARVDLAHLLLKENKDTLKSQLGLALLKLAIEEDECSRAKFLLGCLHYTGHALVEKNYNKSKLLLEEAAKLGQISAEKLMVEFGMISEADVLLKTEDKNAQSKETVANLSQKEPISTEQPKKPKKSKNKKGKNKLKSVVEAGKKALNSINQKSDKNNIQTEEVKNGAQRTNSSKNSPNKNKKRRGRKKNIVASKNSLVSASQNKSLETIKPNKIKKGQGKNKVSQVDGAKVSSIMNQDSSDDVPRPSSSISEQSINILKIKNKKKKVKNNTSAIINKTPVVTQNGKSDLGGENASKVQQVKNIDSSCPTKKESCKEDSESTVTYTPPEVKIPETLINCLAENMSKNLLFSQESTFSSKTFDLLIGAIKLENCDLIKQIVYGNNMSVNQIYKLYGNKTPLHYATEYGNRDVVKLLISLGADVHAITKNGFNPLLVAAKFGHTHLIEDLVNAGIDINAAPVGTAALHEAAANGHKDTVIKLLELGADPLVRDKEYNYTPAGLSRIKRLDAVCELLIDKMDYKQRFIQNVELRLLSAIQCGIFGNLKVRKFTNALYNDVILINDSDELFRELRKHFLKPEFNEIKDALKSFKKDIINLMNIYNEEKVKARTSGMGKSEEKDNSGSKLKM